MPLGIVGAWQFALPEFGDELMVARPLLAVALTMLGVDIPPATSGARTAEPARYAAACSTGDRG